MTESAFFRPDNEAVARIHEQVAQLVKIKGDHTSAASLLSPEQIAALVETAFLASLRFNEGRLTRVCVAVATAEELPGAFAFAKTVAYDESQIEKLAPAVPRDGCLVVSLENESLRTWGFARNQPGPWTNAIIIQILDPGIIQVGVGPSQRFAILNGRSNPCIGATRDTLAGFLFGIFRKTRPTGDSLAATALWRECSALVNLVRMIAADGHGGTLLIVPSDAGKWSQSLRPFEYRFAGPDATLPAAMQKELDDHMEQATALMELEKGNFSDELKVRLTAAASWRPRAISEGVPAIASLARVDGAVVLTRDLKVIGFGAKIDVSGSAPEAPRFHMFGLEPDRNLVPVPPEDLGGTRHQSAARFVDANRDSVAIVISQDRRVSLMYCNDPSNPVNVVRNAEWLL